MTALGGDATALDAWDWRGEARASLYGVCVGVRVADPAHLAPLVAHLPHGAVPTPGQPVDRCYSVARGDAPDAIYRLFADQRRIARRRDLERLARAFAASARHFVALHARERIFVHAGVVAIGDRAVLIPGRTHSGKTTLVAELVRAGATYYSDEFAVLDADGWVHPFAKPLSIRVAPGQPAALVDVAALGGTAGVTPRRVGAVVATRWVSGARWRPEALTAGRAALRLLDNAVAARPRFSEAGRAIAAALAGPVRAWHGVRGDAHEVARWLVDAIGRGEA